MYNNRTMRSIHALKVAQYLTLILIVISAAVLLAPVARAQVLYGSLTGNVQDGTGASVPGAKVEALNNATGILKQATTPDAGERKALIERIQDMEADDLSTVPYLQGAQVAVTGTNVKGAEDTLDASFKFRYGALSKG